MVKHFNAIVHNYSLYCITLFLANNLYGSMETLKLPVSNFAWVPKEKLQQMTSDYIINLPAQSNVGYTFEVDLIYPNHLHKVKIIYI